MGTTPMTPALFVLLTVCFICGGSGSIGSSLPLMGNPAEKTAPQTSPEMIKPLWQARLKTEDSLLVVKDKIHVATLQEAA
jgi:hypothetical protein